MGYVTSRFGTVLNPLLMSKSCWAVKLRDDTWLSELDMRDDLRLGVRRPFDWSLDLCDTSDVLKIKELWLFAPPSPINPLGVTRNLHIEEPGTAFQFKIGNIDVMGAWAKTTESQVIGKVTDKETGACTCWIWDCGLQQIGSYESSIYRFGSWRPEIAPIGALSHEVMGFRLGNVSSYSPHNP